MVIAAIVMKMQSKVEARVVKLSMQSALVELR